MSSPIRRLSLPVLALLLLLTGCGTINSGLVVPPGESFVLGDNGHGRFTADVRNDGDVPVEIVVRGTDGASRSLGALDPGSQITARFSSADAAVLVNRSEDEARLRVTIRGDTGLSMGYEPTGD